MSLFVGNVSKKCSMQEIESAFKFYGTCKIDLRKRYAFVQFESERCAEEAKQALQNENFSGLRLNIEWSKNSGRFNENRKLKQSGRGRRSPERDREQRWRKEERYLRRSPSYDRRHAPKYSDNEDDLDTFIPFSPRDIELMLRLRQKYGKDKEEVKEAPAGGQNEEGEMIEEKPQASKQPAQEEELQAGEAV